MTTPKMAVIRMSTYLHHYLMLVLFSNLPLVTPNTRQMGVIHHCDDGKSNLKIDWDPESSDEYTCTEQRYRLQDHPITKEECLKNVPVPMHVCMDKAIKYNDSILPRYGNHRPVYPVYGEYRYMPPQRWLHSLEHGAAIFLFHPCAPVSEIQKFREIAQDCLRRHIISPYKLLPKEEPFAIVTWKCRLKLGGVDEATIVDYIKKTATNAPENMAKDGLYDAGILRKSANVTNSDYWDTHLCPNN